MAFWIFEYNPDEVRSRGPLGRSERGNHVRRSRVTATRSAPAIRSSSGKQAPNAAFVRSYSESAPQDMPELESEQPYWVERDTKVRCRVLATITNRDVYLPHTELRSVPDLEDLSMFHGFQQGTNFRVTPEEGACLSRLVAQFV